MGRYSLPPWISSTTLLLFTILYCQPATCEIVLGRLPSYAHGVQGEVSILNDRQLRIRGFSYDGQAPSVWFMGMKNDTTGVYSADGVALPNENENCDNLRRAYRDEDIILTLPRRLRVYDMEAFSVYCYRFCHNFGHIRIPRGIRIPPAPANLPSLNQCYPNYQPCRSNGGGF